MKKATKQRYIAVVGVAILATLLAGCAPGASNNQSGGKRSDLLPKPETTTMRIGLGATEISQFADQVAANQKIFYKYGFDNVTSNAFAGDAKAMSALQAGQIDAAVINPSTAVLSLTTDAPVVILAVNAAIDTDALVTRADIKTAKQLTGKRIAISGLGGGSHASALLALKDLKVDPSKVAFTQAGGQDARVAALIAGSVDAAVVDSALNDKMKAAGLNILVDLKARRLPSGRAGIAVTKDWLAKNPNAALDLVAATLEGQNMFWKDPDLVSKQYAEFAQIPLADATALVKDFQDVGDRPMTWTKQVFTDAKDVLAIVSPELAGVDVTKAYDQTLLQKLMDLGFYKKIGVPEKEE